MLKFAKTSEYVETITGRRRYLDHINDPELQSRSHAERQAVNSTIQGSAADLAKRALLKVDQGLQKFLPRIKCDLKEVNFVLHLHDEIIYEVPEDKARNVCKILKLAMEKSAKLSVPLKVKVKMGKSWGDMKEVVL